MAHKGVEADVYEKRVRSRVGKPVTTKQARSKYSGRGIIRDRCFVLAKPWGHPDRNTSYWDIVDLIEFGGKPNVTALRFGYCRRSRNTLSFAEEKCLTDTFDNMKELFVRAAKEKIWFREFLDGIMEELVRGPRDIT